MYNMYTYKSISSGFRISPPNCVFMVVLRDGPKNGPCRSAKKGPARNFFTGGPQFRYICGSQDDLGFASRTSPIRLRHKIHPPTTNPNTSDDVLGRIWPPEMAFAGPGVAAAGVSTAAVGSGVVVGSVPAVGSAAASDATTKRLIAPPFVLQCWRGAWSRRAPAARSPSAPD